MISTKKMENGFNMYYHNDEWQKPVITEYRTFVLFNEANHIPDNYFAFPWAALLDNHLRNKKMLDNFKILDKTCFTVMQHIEYWKLLSLAKKIGITHIFCSHTSKNFKNNYDIKLIPYSLFPAQCQGPYDGLLANRRFLTSFVGQYERYYISKIREHIFGLFPKYENSKIVRRGMWHYKSMVYMGGKPHAGQSAAESEYISVLKDSVFSLCPSGSGPNSIRIWESMGYGAIPVILADTLVLPCIKNIDWNDVFIIWKESEIGKLNDYLLTLDEGKIESMSKKNIELFHAYFSKDSMINIIKEYYKESP